MLAEQADFSRIPHDPLQNFTDEWGSMINSSKEVCTDEEIKMFDEIGGEIQGLYIAISDFYAHAQKLRFVQVTEQLEDIMRQIYALLPKVNHCWMEFDDTKRALAQQEERGRLYGKQMADWEETKDANRAAGYDY